MLFPNLLHCICLAHSLHRACEYIRGRYKYVDEFVALMKQTLIKCASRVQTFKDVTEGLPLPPVPVITRWGTWLATVSYYALHMEQINRVNFFFYIYLIKLENEISSDF